MQSDNEKEFKRALLILLRKFGIQIVNEASRSPQTQGLVEQANGVVKTNIRAWKMDTTSPGLRIKQRHSNYFVKRLLTILRLFPPSHFPPHLHMAALSDSVESFSTFCSTMIALSTEITLHIIEGFTG